MFREDTRIRTLIVLALLVLGASAVLGLTYLLKSSAVTPVFIVMFWGFVIWFLYLILNEDARKGSTILGGDTSEKP